MGEESGHHRHGGHHAHPPENFGRAFAVGTALNLGLVLAEIAFGWLSNSIALISDGAHNFSDVVGLLLAWGGSWLATRQPSSSRTYGYRRVTILAALANATLLLAATGGLIVEAAQRLADPQPLENGTVLWVASAAIVVNLGTALLFMRGRNRDLNVRSAFLHMVGDAAVSLSVVIAALLIGRTGWLWLDPLAGIVVALAILKSGWGLMRDALGLALDAVPAGVDRRGVEAYLASLSGVVEVHDLHIWAMSTTETALTAHLVRPNAEPDDWFLTAVADELDQRFGIGHVTIQIESGNSPCRFAPADVV